MKKRLVTIVGPTGVGKTSLALKLGLEFSGEIVSADSRQIYRGMDIGTAKSSDEDMAKVPHHLIDIVEPNDAFSLAQYQSLAYKSIEDILARKRLPILVGGSGQYVWAVLEGWSIPKVTPNNWYREELEKRLLSGESEELFQELKQMNPELASRVDKRNPRRLIRAMEISKFSDHRTARSKNPPDYSILIIGLTCPRHSLYKRIDLRVEQMISAGLESEVRELRAKNYADNSPSMSGIGYRQMISYIKGDINLVECVNQIKFESHRLARQQYNWFGLGKSEISWFDVDTDYYQSAKSLVNSFIKE